jgi:AbrB family looped-hinge helix DNA binding protein
LFCGFCWSDALKVLGFEVIFKLGSSQLSIAGLMMAIEVVVRKKGQITIPVGIRRRLTIGEGTRLEVVVTDEGLLLKPKRFKELPPLEEDPLWKMMQKSKQLGIKDLSTSVDEHLYGTQA